MLVKNSRRHQAPRGSRLAIPQLFTGIGLALTAAIWSLYLSSFGFDDAKIGLLSAGFVVCSLLGTIFSPMLFKHLRLKTIITTTLVVSVGAYTIMGLTAAAPAFITMVAITSATDVIRMNAFGILFRDNIRSKDLNRAEGVLFTLLNVAWFISPLVTAALLRILEMKGIFFFSAAFFAIGLVLFLSVKKKEVMKKHHQTNILSNVKDYFKKERLRKPYLVAAGLQSWWSFIYVFVPLFLFQEGLPESAISIFIGVVTLPLIINEYAISKLSETQQFRRLFSIGFFGLAAISGAAALLGATYAHLFLFTFASFFVSCIEPLQDTFFFRRARQDEEDQHYPVFNTAYHAGGFATRAAIAAALLITGPKGVYVLMMTVMAVIGLSTLTIRD